MAAPAQELAPAITVAQPQGGVHDVTVLTLYRLKDRMKQQLSEYSAAVRSSQENFLDHVIEEKVARSAIQDLQRDIEEVKVSIQNKMLALQRIQTMDALRKKMNQDHDDDSHLILETMKCIVTLSRTIIEYQQQVREKEQQLIDIKRKRVSLKNDGGEKLQEIRTTMRKQKEKLYEASMNVADTEKMLDNLRKERDMTTVIQNVFQNIIIGSGVNWAEDPFLKAIVLQLERSVYIK